MLIISFIVLNSASKIKELNKISEKMKEIGFNMLDIEDYCWKNEFNI